MGRFFLIAFGVMGLFASILNTAAPSGSSGKNDFAARIRAENASESGSDWSEEGETGTQDGAVTLERNSDGHFYADVMINGASVRMLVDTGATGIALSREAARSAGVATSIGMNEVVGEGADGAVRGEFVQLDRVELGHRKAQGLNAIVLNSGQMSLLGQSFLSEFDSVQIEGDRMVLR